MSAQPSDYATMLAKNGGIVCCGSHLGIVVGTDINAVPPGWTYVSMPTNPEIVQRAIDHAKVGRATWPNKIGEDSSDLGRPQ